MDPPPFFFGPSRKVRVTLCLYARNKIASCLLKKKKNMYCYLNKRFGIIHLRLEKRTIFYACQKLSVFHDLVCQTVVINNVALLYISYMFYFSRK